MSKDIEIMQLNAIGNIRKPFLHWVNKAMIFADSLVF